MTKQDFITTMELISTNIHTNKAMSELIRHFIGKEITPSYTKETVNELLAIVKEKMGINDNLLSWWFWEDVEKVVYLPEKKVKVNTLEQLYGFIVAYYGG